jgi:hypothetical protein
MVYRAPEVPEKYLSYRVDDYMIYISKTAAVGANAIHFDVRGFWVFKEIVANGIHFPKV